MSKLFIFGARYVYPSPGHSFPAGQGKHARMPVSVIPQYDLT